MLKNLSQLSEEKRKALLDEIAEYIKTKTTSEFFVIVADPGGFRTMVACIGKEESIDILREAADKIEEEVRKKKK